MSPLSDDALQLLLPNGTTAYGGANGLGTVFKITPRGTLTTLYSFCSQTNCTDGRNPEAALVQAGTTGILHCTRISSNRGSATSTPLFSSASKRSTLSIIRNGDTSMPAAVALPTSTAVRLLAVLVAGTPITRAMARSAVPGLHVTSNWG